MMNRCLFLGRLLCRSYISSPFGHLTKPLYIIRHTAKPLIEDQPYNKWNLLNARQIFTHKRNKFGMVKHWRRKRKKVLIRKSLIPWRPERKSTRTYKMPKERRVFKVGWSKNRRGGRMLKIRRQR